MHSDKTSHYTFFQGCWGIRLDCLIKNKVTARRLCIVGMWGKLCRF
jgi:hypothetical protein